MALFEALSSLNFSGGVKLLDNAIKKRATEGEQTVDASLQQLYYMRGFCLQKLELFRKALKVLTELEWASAPHGQPRVVGNAQEQLSWASREASCSLTDDCACHYAPLWCLRMYLYAFLHRLRDSRTTIPQRRGVAQTRMWTSEEGRFSTGSAALR